MGPHHIHSCEDCFQQLRPRAALCPFCGKKRTDKKVPCVYFIRSDETGAIKIGKSVDAVKRIASLQTGNDATLVLLLAVEGWSHAEEAEIHRRFARLRIRSDGEWFKESSTLLSFIEALTAKVARLPTQSRIRITLSDIRGIKVRTRRRPKPKGMA